MNTNREIDELNEALELCCPVTCNNIMDDCESWFLYIIHELCGPKKRYHDLLYSLLNSHGYEMNDCQPGFRAIAYNILFKLIQYCRHNKRVQLHSPQKLRGLLNSDTVNKESYLICLKSELVWTARMKDIALQCLYQLTLYARSEMNSFMDEYISDTCLMEACAAFRDMLTCELNKWQRINSLRSRKSSALNGLWNKLECIQKKFVELNVKRDYHFLKLKLFQALLLELEQVKDIPIHAQ